MFQVLVDEFKSIIQKQGFCTARLYVDGLAAQVTTRYLPDDAMELRGLPSELPAFLLFKGNEVYLDPQETQSVAQEEEKGFYLLYRTWDPRVIARAEPQEKEIEASGGRWEATYELTKAVRLYGAIQKRIKKYASQLQEVEFVTDGLRLLELTEYDFTAYPTRLTLVFQYPQG